MDEQPHVEACPGCQAAKLTEEDRVYLRSTGWQDPRHVLVPRPQMAPPPKTNETAVTLAGLFGGLVWLGLVGQHPIPTLAMTVVVVGVIILLYRNHKVNHREDGQPKSGCNFCRREDRKRAAKEWAKYRHLAAADRVRTEREAHATHYQQLLEQERRRQHGAQ